MLIVVSAIRREGSMKGHPACLSIVRFSYYNRVPKRDPLGPLGVESLEAEGIRPPTPPPPTPLVREG